MEYKKLLRESGIVYRSTALSFIKSVWWLVVILNILPYSYEYFGAIEAGWLELFLDGLRGLDYSLLAMFGFVVLLKSKNINVELTSGKVFTYLFAMLFIGLASLLGYMLLLIPGLIILSVSAFTALFILHEDQGPIEAMASSTSLLGANWVKFTLLFSALWGISALLEWLCLLVISNDILSVIGMLLTGVLFDYFILCVIFNAYFALQEEITNTEEIDIKV